MTDYFHIICDNIRLYSDNLIAFFPDDGFLIYEGYSYARKSQMPFNLELVRASSKYNIEYKITITDIHKKYKKSRRPFEICKCGPEDDCLCNVSFQPEDLIIVKFTVDSIYTNAPEGFDWRTCMDHRYDTPEELLSAYTKLVELSEDSWSVATNPAHEQFYKEYYEQLDNNIDIFQADRELPHFINK